MHKVRHLFLALIWALFILLLYGIHTDDIPEIEVWDLLSEDKLAHAFVFALLTHLILVGLNKQTYSKMWRNKAVQIAVIFSVCYGSILELIQGTVFASRSTELADLVANCVGVGLGLLMFRLVYGRLYVQHD